MSTTFGALLRQARKQAGMTQGDLAAATGYSRSLIAALERNLRLPDLESLIQTYLPALGLQDEPRLASQLVELAALARGERVPTSLTLKRERRLVLTTETTADPPPLPILPTQLLGRDQEISHLCHRLLGYHGRLLTLVGPPGVGKTSLALAVAAHLHLHYQDGVRYVPLAAITDPALVATTIVNALKLPDSPAKPPQTLLVEHLRRKEMLLLLDNFEQIIAAAPLLAVLLAECVGLCLLVTSRERLHLRAEQRYKVPSLDLEAAVELFVQRAQAVNGDFSLTAHNRPTLETICERLDCLPLAIELCAAQIELFSPGQLLIELQARPLDLLVNGAHDLPPQQRTLRRAIERSYMLLSAEEQTLFRQLGIFFGGFNLAAMEAIGDWRLNDSVRFQSPVSTLRSLIGKSLVRAETLANGEQRFFLLETIREFALELLQGSSEDKRVRQRHANHFYAIACRSTADASQAEKGKFYQQMEPDYPNLRAALCSLIDHQPHDGLRMANTMADFWWARGYSGEGQIWLHKALSAAPALSIEQAKVWLGIANLTHVYSKFPERESYANNALQICQQLGDETLLAACYRQLGLSKYLGQQFTEAERLFRQGYAIAHKNNQASIKAELQSLVALVQANRGILDDPVRAELEAALTALQRFGDTAAIARAAAGLCWFDIRRGDYARALPFAAQALLLARQSQDKHAMAMAESYTGDVAMIQKDFALAGKHYQDAFQHFNEIGDSTGIDGALYRLGRLAEIELRYAEAQALYQQSLQYCLKHNNRRYQLRCLIGLAGVALAQNAIDSARQLLTEAQEVLTIDPLLLTPHDQIIYQQLLAAFEFIQVH